MKDVKKLFLLIICCFLNVSFCYADGVGVSFNTIDSGEVNVGEDDSEKEPVYKSLVFADDENYTCHFKYNLTYGSSIMAYGYNQQNTSIINGLVTAGESIKAGTSIGISIVETASVGWEIVDYWVTKKTSTIKVFWWNEYDSITCNRIDRDTCRIENYVYGDESRKCSAEFLSAYNKASDFKCNKTGQTLTSKGNYNETGSGETETSEKKSECLNMANQYANNIAKASKPSPSYDVTLNDPNDVKISGTVVEPKSSSASLNTNPCVWKYIYTPLYVCMNKKTAEVRYSDGPCSDNDSEFHIKNDIINGIEHFHYFIPLNVADGVYSLIINPKSKSNKNSCFNVIENNSNYYDFLFTSTGGVYKPVSKNESVAKVEVADGCYVGTEIKIPVSNGFYKVDSNSKIRGFNFYVKMIDEFDPFPNAIINEDSLWYEWYQKNYNSNGEYAYNRVEPNIKSSFNDISYSVENVNAKLIRDFNDDISYLNNSITILGKSDFINNTLTFDVVDNSYYKLGCGPLNSNEMLSDGTANPLYQEGCKK